MMNPLSSAAALAFALTVLPCGALAVTAPHDRAAASSAAPIAAPATRWATDAPLREGMAKVRLALDELRHFEMGHMPPAMAAERARTIEEAIRFMFAHCKLDPQADAALHHILVPLLAAAQRVGKDPHDVAAVDAMRRAVADYPRYFDDPAWSAARATGDAPHAD